MGEQTGKPLWARAALWKSALVIAPLAATALFLASGTQAQTSGSTAPLNPPAASTTVMPKPAPVAARSKGPKLRDKVDRVTGPSPITDPATPTQTATPVARIDAPDAARRGGPKGGGRDKEDVGRTEAPAPDAQPAARRKEGPKGDGSSDAAGGRTETPTSDTQPAARRKGPKPRTSSDHQGRTSATPLIIGALGAATALALVVSSGNDRPASP
jgi:hypothetical protein